MDLRSTLHLPDADFTIPMKADLPKLEPKLLAIWDEQDIYRRIQEVRANAPTYVLHDGPPYTNSPIHLGTAVNKILKDFTVKSHSMMGFRAPYVPGYDNHGLPIEQAVVKKLQEKKIDFDIVTLRKACREHAAEYIGVQTQQFSRLGVFGLWDKPYTTMNFRFEAEIVRVFKRLAQKGFVYKGLRPTQWSPTSQTALADTEIVYHDHVSKAIYVRFALRDDPNRLFEKYENLYTIIWTTTPWTIPANLAVAFQPEFTYAVVRVGDVHYLVLDSLVNRLAEVLEWSHFEVVDRMDGINFDGMEFSHPIFDRPSLAVMAEYVTGEDGTGVVHTAPSHGRDDFFTGQKYKLPVPNTVNERGVLTAETGEFEGVYYKNCDTVVVDRLAELGALLKVSDYPHSYPYSERDNQPVIFRATEQWFVAMEHDELRARMLEQIQLVQWVPETGQNRIEAMVRNRPDWCISRQRPWGVGIPIFYGAQTRKPVLDPVAIEAVAKLIEAEGSDAWFVRPAAEILPEGYEHPDTGETEFVKETDVLDVWFDSGSTSMCVLEGNVEPEWKESLPADVYFEGSDQHRGWFNSSLILGTAILGEAPYKAVVTHGFVMDEKGVKMSKRLGNVVDPVAACEQLGADILRYWAASVDYFNDVPCSMNLLKQFGDSYRNVRNTLRFLLSNLSGADLTTKVEEILPLDEWIMEQTDLLVADCVTAYEAYDFGAVINAVHNFCREELSKFYLDAIKDRMYCDGKEWPSRRSGQFASHYVLVRLVKLLAPILPFTCEETWAKIPGTEGSVHFQVFDVPTEERLGDIEASALQVRFARLLEVRALVFAQFEQWKTAQGLKDSQDASANITLEPEMAAALREFDQEDLDTLFKFARVQILDGDEFAASFRVSEFMKCERSRLRRANVREVMIDGEKIPLSERDLRVLQELGLAS
ncbi:MAG: isoleucine--tRNA ligase [Fimbriimonas sp.]